MIAHQLALTLRSAYLAMHRRTEAAVAGVGITADQFVVLAALMEGDTLSQRELVERTASDPNTLRAMLLLLEGKNLIERRPHPTDRRARSVAISRQGRVVFQRAWSASQPLRASMLQALPNQQASKLDELLRQLVAVLLAEPSGSKAPDRKLPDRRVRQPNLSASR